MRGSKSRLFVLIAGVLSMWLDGCVYAARPFPVRVQPLPSATATPFSPLTNTPPPPTATPTATPWASPTPRPTLTASPTATPAPLLRPLYNISAVLDFWQRTLTADERILYTNTASASLNRLVLNVEPNQWEGVFHLLSATANGRPVQGTLRGTLWTLPLPHPLAPGRSLALEIHYRLTLPYRTGSRIFGMDARQTNLVDWYPFIVPYDGQTGWLWHKPWPFGDHLVYPSADFDITLKLKHAAANTQIAASAPPDAHGHYRLHAARTFVFSLSAAFETTTSKAGAITITSYYFADLADGGKALPAYAAKAVQTFSAAYGVLPRRHLAIVATDAPDGMEYSGLVFLSRNFYTTYAKNARGTVINNLVSLGMHELSHQWWYDQVGNDQALHPWMDEALAVYSEWLFYRQNYPADVPLWWAFRVNYFQPRGEVNRSIYDYPSFRPYVNATYLQGARFLEALRRRIGDRAFFAFLHDYYTQMQGRIATPEDFFRILNAHTDTPYQDILTAYFAPMK